MFRGLFVTGTDTDVGKTTVAAALMHRFRQVRHLRYWKPVQTGIENSDDTQTVAKLGGCSEEELHTPGVRLPRPLAPYLAAELSGTRVTIAGLMQLAPKQNDMVPCIAEGAGGVRVPINESEYMVDLMAALGLPVMIVARSSLGTINHTLLTIESLRNRPLDVVGVVMVGHKNPENRKAIEKYGAVSVIDEMPWFPTLTSETLGRWATSEFDRQGQLTRYFQ
jgi:dethiobiotin synthase